MIDEIIVLLYSCTNMFRPVPPLASSSVLPAPYLTRFHAQFSCSPQIFIRTPSSSLTSQITLSLRSNILTPQRVLPRTPQIALRQCKHHILPMVADCILLGASAAHPAFAVAVHRDHDVSVLGTRVDGCWCGNGGDGEGGDDG